MLRTLSRAVSDADQSGLLGRRRCRYGDVGADEEGPPGPPGLVSGRNEGRPRRVYFPGVSLGSWLGVKENLVSAIKQTNKLLLLEYLITIS